MKLTPKHVDAMRYVSSGDHRRSGMSRPDLQNEVDDLKRHGMTEIKFMGDSAFLFLTHKGMSLLSSLTK